MPRARNIKHGFFTNDDLAEIDPIGRLLFIGLWTLADYKGDLKWKSKRIKAQLLPYDECDVEALAINLDKSGFIQFYSDGDNLYVRVVNFVKHQNPHKNERSTGSDVPAYSNELRQLVDLKGLTINRDKSGVIPDHSDSDRADSCFLIPDSCSLIPEEKDLSAPAKPDAKSARKQQSIELMNLWNQTKTEYGTNWTAVDDPEHTSQKRYSAGASRVDYIRGYLKRNGKPEDWDSVKAWFQSFYQHLAGDPFYSGLPTDQNPKGYRATFEQVHAEEYFVKAIERLKQGWLT